MDGREGVVLRKNIPDKEQMEERGVRKGDGTASDAVRVLALHAAWQTQV